MSHGLPRRLPRSLVLSTLTGLSLVMGLVLSPVADAFPYPAFKVGRVVARSLVRTPEGHPIYAEYGENGKSLRDIGPATGELEKAQVISGGRYLIYQAQLRALLEQFPFPGGLKKCTEEPPASERRPGACLMTLQEYKDANFKTLDDKALNDGVKPEPLSDTRSLLVRRKEALVTPDTNPVLMQAGVDLNEAYDKTLGSNIVSLLLDKNGKVHTESPNNIGFKAAYFENESESYLSDGRNRNKKALGPLKGVVVEGPAFSYPIYALTDEQGKYSMQYLLPPCPGFTFEYTSDAYALLHYRNFNPRGFKIGTYYLKSPGYDFCNGLGDVPIGFTLQALMTQVEMLAIRASIAIPNIVNNFYADTVVLTGRAVMRNPDGSPIDVGVPTSYGANVPALEGVLHQYDEDGDGENDLGFDFDGDGKPEKLVRGKQTTVEGKTRFVPDGAGDLVGVYLSAGNRKPDSENEELQQPDFTRLLDQKADYKHQGLLKSLSFEDLKKTDLYVFRESNGQLITERKGLKTDEFTQEGGVDEAQKAIHYRVFIRGPYSSANGVSARTFEQFQVKSKMNPLFHKREADHVRAGENVRLILINRVTGYIGTYLTPLKTSQERAESFISFPIEDIRMLPPNLKIRAERRLTVEKGLTKGEERDYLIGFEGGATNKDTIVEISTEWYDQDGRPLPEGLKEYGYTGRLAKIVGAKQVGPGDSGVASFAIEPGSKRQVLRLKDEIMSKDHFYIHVAGEPKSRNPQFGQGGAGTGILQDRPTRYVPVIVPLFDEKEYLTALRAWRKAKDEAANADKEFLLKRPKPVYRWRYRPEMQFSVYELAMQKILRGNADGSTDIQDSQLPGLGSSDQFVELVYKMLAQNLEPLDRLNGAPELVFAVGEQELKAQMTESGQLRFDNLQHLASLNPEDFLTMRMYLNHDPENLLWQFAFEYLALESKTVGSSMEGDKSHYVSADDPVLPMHAVLVGYLGRDQKYKTGTRRVIWDKKGPSGYFVNQTENQDAGVFTADFKLPPQAGAYATVTAELQADAGSLKTEYKKVVVVPGKPARMNVRTNGDVFIVGHKGLDVEVEVWDKNGNRVTDNTSVNFQVQGNAVIDRHDPGTKDGRANAFIKGTMSPSAESKLVVTVDSLREEIPFEVKPLNIEFLNSPTQFDTNSSYDLTVKVSEPSGGAVPNVNVHFFSTFGKFKDQLLQTGAEGLATTTMHTGFGKTDGTLYARVGLVGATPKAVSVRPSRPEALDAPYALVVGDRDQTGYVDYERYDGAKLGLRYEVDTTFTMNAVAGRSYALQLGDLADPNLAPVAAYYMNDLIGGIATDETGLHNGSTLNVDVVEDDPTKTGHSFWFNKEALDADRQTVIGSAVQIQASAALLPETNVGFRLDFKASAPGGALFNLEEGSQSLNFTEDRRLRYSVQTDAGVIAIESAPLNLNEWHTIGGRYQGGTLELQVDGSHVPTVTGGARLAYSSRDKGLVLGRQYTGLLNSVRWYNGSAQPLLTFEDGSTNKVVDFPPDTTELAPVFRLRSTGQMNALQSGSALTSLRTPIIVEGERHYIGLISAEYYTDIAGAMVTAGKGTVPPIEVSDSGRTREQYQPSPLLDLMIKPAHAGWFDWSVDDIWGAVKEGVSWIIPYEEAMAVFTQLKYLLTSDPRFDAAELAINTIGVLSVIPVAKALKPLSKGLLKFYRSLGPVGRRYMKAVAEVVSKYADDIMDGKFDRLAALLPYLITVGELAADAEAREGLMLMVETVSSSDEFLTWVDYISLPADGWDGNVPPPAVEVGFNQTEAQFAWPATGALFASNALDLFVPKAHAAPGGARKISAQAIKEILKPLKKLRQHPKMRDLSQISHAIKEVVGGMKAPNISVKEWRKLAFNKEMVRTAINLFLTKGAIKVRKLSQGIKDARISPLGIVAIVGYLETRSSEGCKKDDAEDPCAPLFEGESDKVDSLRWVDVKLGMVLVDALDGNQDDEEDGDEDAVSPTQLKPLRENGHGALFHLAMLAAYHGNHEFAGGPKVLAMERKYKVDLYEEKASADIFTTFGREVDIVVQGAESGPPLWVETKSYKYTPKYQSRWSAWTLVEQGEDGKRVKAHRQYFLDRVAMTQRNPSIAKMASDVVWWFQSFKQRTEHGYRKSEIEYVGKQFGVLPKLSKGKQSAGNPASPIAELNVRVSGPTEKAAYEAKAKQHPKLFTPERWITRTMAIFLMKNYADDVKNALLGKDGDIDPDAVFSI